MTEVITKKLLKKSLYLSGVVVKCINYSAVDLKVLWKGCEKYEKRFF